MKNRVNVRLGKIIHKKYSQNCVMDLPKRLYCKQCCVVQPEKPVIIVFNYS